MTSATTQSAARTISNFFGRVPGVPVEIDVCFESTQASDSSSSIPKIMRAATWLGIEESISPFSWPALMIAPSMLAMLFTVCLCLALTHERTERDLRETQRQLRVLADIDMLTQVPNRRHFEELAGAALGGGHGGRAVLMLFDIDHFKRINDTHGHAAGDEALRVVARCAREALRTRDVLGRFGGDEFMLLLPAASVDDALQVAERITRRIDGHAGAGLALSLSFGVVDIDMAGGESLEAARIRADLALYEAKRQGRRRAVPASQRGPQTVFGDSRAFGDSSLGLSSF